MGARGMYRWILVVRRYMQDDAATQRGGAQIQLALDPLRAQHTTKSPVNIAGNHFQK